MSKDSMSEISIAITKSEVIRGVSWIEPRTTSRPEVFYDVTLPFKVLKFYNKFIKHHCLNTIQFILTVI